MPTNSGMPHKRHVLTGIGLSAAVAGSALGGPAAAGSVKDATMHASGPRAGLASTLTGYGTAVTAPPSGQQGQRMGLSAIAPGSDGVVNNQFSTNWSGLVATRRAGTLRGAAAQWSVPALKQQSASPRYSSTWVGVDGYKNGDLIQTGTDQFTHSAAAHPYKAWVEILPAAARTIINPRTGVPAPVHPGDKIAAHVVRAGTHIWTIYLQDKTQGWYFQQNFAYSGPGTSAEWIEEAPTINGKQSSVANFGKVNVSRTVIAVDGRAGWHSTLLTAGSNIKMRQKGVVKATPSAPLPRGGSSTGQHFTVTFR